ncbi:MAG: TIGR03557 family F420-dependent LLM class oxidoreductase [Candidatus Bathyarchaeia archaeon]|nr:TIGR03557 family F420-dependent LLM class oxidoreductase [Candidatus Bathyarchaeota archaeon]
MNCTFGFYAAQEQYDPNELLHFTIKAEKLGFDTIWTSDHFHPWAHTNAKSSFAWVWLAAAAERTKKVSLGSVTAPLLRYHPGVVAQAFATLDFMHPGRIFLCLGTGESMNEAPLGLRWPPYKERLNRLEESIIIIRRLWKESFVDFDGKHYCLRKANLYTKPKSKIPLYVAANGSSAAYIAGKYADGLLTSGRVFDEKFSSEIFPALVKGAKDAGRNPEGIKKIVHIITSYDEDFERAVEGCKFWNATMIPGIFEAEVYDPRDLELKAKSIGREDIVKRRFIITSEEEAIKKIELYLKFGVNEVEFLSTSPDQNKFIEFFGKKVFPYFRDQKRDG